MLRVTRIKIYITIYSLIFLETTVLGRFKVFGALPDLAINAVLYFGFFFTPKIGLEAGIVTGLLKDIFSVGFPGYNTIMYALMGFICGFISDKVYRDSFITQGIAAFIAALFITKFRLSSCIYTMLAAPLVFIVLEAIYRAGQTEEIGL